MKQRAALLVVACAFLVAIVMSGGRYVNSNAVANGINHSSVNATLIVDGGAPIPPLPPPCGKTACSSLVADGGAPIPPLPPPSGLSSSVKLMADGGAPIPPLPPPSGLQVNLSALIG